ncbi:hypothetical protein M885DRAFT_167469 [Pelagophyceae sp. CCMP2097]|nr:hypothetical protein M885DRAFT_167469 [Pelagophyceae sp. CCMP2097]
MTSEACSGACAAGYFCPEPGATLPTMRECGGFDKICPLKGSVAPLDVSAGYYTAVSRNAFADDSLLDKCPAGRYRDASNVSDASLKRPSVALAPTFETAASCARCPAGTFKAVEGDALSACVPCDSFTAVATADRRTCSCLRAAGGSEIEDAELLWFNASANRCDVIFATEYAEKVAIANLAANKTIFTFTKAYECEPGFWCRGAIKRPCPKARYGNALRETSPDCAGECAQGFYCPEASTSPKAVACGAVEDYCPAASWTPLRVASPGYFTTGGSSNTRTGFEACPAGEYCLGGLRFDCSAGRYGAAGAAYADADCAGPCARGYYCPERSTAATANACGGPAFVCPTGSAKPIAVPDGYFSVHGGADGDERSYYDAAGLRMDSMLPCTPGSYCVGGVRRKCADFRYGWQYFATDAQCDGGLAAGCYAPLSKEPYLGDCPFECGGNDVYCPNTGREVRPTPVSPGYYTFGGTNSTRTRQAKCKPGTFCSAGLVYDCPQGKYQPLHGATKCDLLCPTGAYCPQRSPAPLPCAEGTYSTGAAHSCSKCPNFDAGSGLAQRCFDDRLCCEALTR